MGLFRIVWRLQRRGLIGMTAFGVLYGLIQAGAYSSVAGTTVAARAIFGRQMQTFGTQLSTMLPLPQHVETLPGYLQWRVFGALPLLFGFWAVMSAVGATRGDEEHGIVELWLAAGASRVRYVAVRYVVFAIVATVSVALTALSIDLGAARSGQALDPTALVELALALLGLVLAVYALAALAAQTVTSRNAAAGVAGITVLVLFFINGFSRTNDSLLPLAHLSPFYYYDRTNPLSPGGSFDAAGTLAVFAASVVIIALTAWLMQRRDIGSPLFSRRPRAAPETFRPSANPLLRLPVLSRLYEQRVSVVSWALASALLGFYMASVSRSLVDVVHQGGGFRGYLTLAGHGNPYVALASFFWFGIFQTLLAVYAITVVARWSSDDNEGRLEMELSAPLARWRVVLERAVALALAAFLVIGISSAGFYVGAAVTNIGVPVGDLMVASVLLVPFVLAFAAVGALCASRVPRATVAVLTTVAFLSYLITELGPLLKMPDWLLKLSLFSLYGSPMTSGVYWTGLWIMAAIVIAGFGSAGLLMQRRDVGS
jgi:ABC-2 type transport system permease protein